MLLHSCLIDDSHNMDFQVDADSIPGMYLDMLNSRYPKTSPPME